MAEYSVNHCYDYNGGSQNYSRPYDDYEASSYYNLDSTAYANGPCDESSSPRSEMVLSSIAMTPNESQSSHGSRNQHYTQSSPQWRHGDSYECPALDFDQSSVTNTTIYTPRTAQSEDAFEFEQASSSSSPSAYRVSKRRDSSLHYSNPPEDPAEPWSPQDLSPLSPVSPLFSSRSRKGSSARKSDVSYACLAHYCTSTAHFKRPADLQRHYDSVHSKVLYDCPIRKCSRKGDNGLGRKDHLRDHLKDVHMKSPEQVKLWMDVVQTMTNLRNIKKSLTPEELLKTEEMERKMPTARSILNSD